MTAPGFESTYKELKFSYAFINLCPSCSFESTYKELKLPLYRTVYTLPALSFESTYKELKLAGIRKL